MKKKNIFVLMLVVSLMVGHSVMAAQSRVNNNFDVNVTPLGKYIYKIPDALDTENWMVFLNINNNLSKPIELRNVKFDIYSDKNLITSDTDYYNISILSKKSHKISMLFFREKKELNSNRMLVSVVTDAGIKEININLKRYKQPVKVYLPLKGVWQISSAHEFGITHRRWDNRAQFAYDFDKIDGNGELYKGNPKNLNDYYAFGQPVYAPADCTVFKVHDGEKDNPIGKVTKHANYVMLNLGKNVFCEMAHFKNGSIIVKEGQHLKKGDKIAEVGNSGMSDNPHLHMQIQDYDINSNQPLKPGFPLPLSFSDFYQHPSYLNRWVFEKEGNPHSGYFVKAEK